MTPTDIETIVAEVIRRLTAVAAAPAVGVPASAWSGNRLKAELQPGVLSLDERVITLNSVDHRLDGLRRLIVPKKAIVTPALKDELTKRGIELDRGGEQGSLRREATVGIVRCHLVKAPAVPGVEDVTADSLDKLVRLVNEQLSTAGRRVLVLIGQPALAVCALNRDRQVRAAQAQSVDCVRTASRAIAANVLVVDPAHLGRVQLGAIVRAMENEEVRGVPAGL
jgi:hypothetical protein